MGLNIPPVVVQAVEQTAEKEAAKVNTEPVVIDPQVVAEAVVDEVGKRFHVHVPTFVVSTAVALALQALNHFVVH